METIKNKEINKLKKAYCYNKKSTLNVSYRESGVLYKFFIERMPENPYLKERSE